MSLSFAVSNLRTIQRDLRREEEVSLETLRTCLDNTIDELISLAESVDSHLMDNS